MGTVRYVFRIERRRRWRAWLARGVLYGLLAGAVLAAVAGARRTDSAYDRFLAAQDAYDVLLPNTGEQGLAVLDPEAVAALPQVADSSTLVYGYVEVGTGEAALADPSGRLGRDLNRFDMLEGRAPQAIDEAAVSFPVADRYGLEVGDTISTYPLSDEQRQALGDDLPDGRLTVVGIEASPGEFPPQYPGAGMVHLSPALARSGVLGEPTAIAVRLEHGSADVPAFRRALEELAGDEPFSSILQTEQSGEVERSIHLQALAFWVLAGVLTLVAVTIIAQVESRSTHAESEDLPIVAALGATRSQRFTAALAPRISISVIASITAVLTAAALSPLAPIGLARIAEPSAGFHVDPLVVLLGAVGVMVLIPLLTVPACWAAARRHAASIGAVGGATTGRHEPLLARAAANISPTAATGVRFAVETGGGRDSVPVRSTVLGVTLAVGVLAAALTFAASLHHLLTVPRLYGVVWTTQLTNYGSGPDLAPEAERLRERPDVEAVAVGETGIPSKVNGEALNVLLLDSDDPTALPPLLEGHQAEADRDIVLGGRTLRDLGVAVGDTVEVQIADLTPAQFTVVGSVVMPSSPQSNLGEGAVISRAGVLSLGAPADALAPDLFVRTTPGADLDAIVATLPTGADDGTGVLALPLDAPSDVVNFGRVDALPALVAGLVAVVAASTLAHTLLSAARRRRRDLAVLKTIGFVDGQVRAAVRWQALTLVSMALLVGVPLGVVVGRWAWVTLADQLGVLPVAVIPGLALLLLIPITLVIAVALAFFPARLAARTPAASVLRAG